MQTIMAKTKRIHRNRFTSTPLAYATLLPSPFRIPGIALVTQAT